MGCGVIETDGHFMQCLNQEMQNEKAIQIDKLKNTMRNLDTHPGIITYTSKILRVGSQNINCNEMHDETMNEPELRRAINE